MEIQAGAQQSSETYRVRFTGAGWDYFGIWIANLALSVITLGIYSPWAKVRRTRYFYQNTTLAGSGLDFHGDPFRILVGRILAIVFFVIYSSLTKLSGPWKYSGYLFFFCIFPVLMHRALRFRLRATSFRNVRFRFLGSAGGVFRTMFLIPILCVLPFGLLYPMSMRAWRRYQLGSSAYGAARFDFDQKLWLFYASAFFSMILPFAGAFTLVAIVLKALPKSATQLVHSAHSDKHIDLHGLLGSIGLGTVVAVVLLFSVGHAVSEYFKHKIIWNGLSLGPYRFRSTITLGSCIWVLATDSIFSIVTLGLFRPFAAISAARLKYENIEITGPKDMADFAADSSATPAAMGEEAVDLFDFDIGL